MMVPSALPVTSSVSLSLRCEMQWNTVPFIMWYPSRRSFLMSIVTVLLSRPHECSRCGCVSSTHSPDTALLCSVNCVSSSRFAADHSRTAPSSPPVAIIVGVVQLAVTVPRCAVVRCQIWSPLCASKPRTPPSDHPVTSVSSLISSSDDGFAEGTLERQRDE